MPVASRAVRPRTRAGRLDALDAWLVHEGAGALRLPGAVIDVGYGASPVTTCALARAVRAVRPGLRVVGLEQRAAAVAPEEPLELVVGDFATLPALGPACVVRAMNVLRGYREAELPAIHAALGEPLVEGGLVLEGTSDVEGHVLTAWVLRRVGGALVREALLLTTDFTRGFSPWLFRDFLPQDLRRQVKPGTAVHALLARWAAVVEAGAPGRAPRERFEASVPQVPGLAATPWELAHGCVRAAL